MKKDKPKKEKAETIIQSVKEQEEPTQAVLQSVTTPSKIFKKSFRTNNTSNIKTSVVDTVDNPVSETSSQPENVIVPNAPK
jgi:hypothetical protein